MHYFNFSKFLNYQFRTASRIFRLSGVCQNVGGGGLHGSWQKFFIGPTLETWGKFWDICVKTIKNRQNYVENLKNAKFSFQTGTVTRGLQRGPRGLNSIFHCVHVVDERLATAVFGQLERVLFLFAPPVIGRNKLNRRWSLTGISGIRCTKLW